MSGQNFQGGYTVLPPILSAQNSEEKLAVNGHSKDNNGIHVELSRDGAAKSGNSLDINSNSVDNTETEKSVSDLSTSQGTQKNGTELPQAPFSSIVQQKLLFEDRYVFRKHFFDTYKILYKQNRLNFSCPTMNDRHLALLPSVCP